MPSSSSQYVSKPNIRKTFHLTDDHPIIQKETKNHIDDDDTSVMSLEIACGDFVVIQAMKSSPELNGKIAKVKHESNQEGQWLVQLHETGEKIVVDENHLFLASFIH